MIPVSGTGLSPVESDVVVLCIIHSILTIALIKH